MARGVLVISQHVSFRVIRLLIHTLTYSALTSPILYVPGGGSPLLDSPPPDLEDILPRNDPARPLNHPPPDDPEGACSVVVETAASGTDG